MAGTMQADLVRDGVAEDGAAPDGGADGGAGTGLAALFEPRPRFRRRLRGYDCADVDDYVAWVEEELLPGAGAGGTSACSRCNDVPAPAPAEVPTPHAPAGREDADDHDAVLLVGTMRELLRLAEERARDLVADAEAEAAQLRVAARAEADARLGNVADLRRAAVAARQEAQAALEQARRQADELLTAADAERARLDAAADAERTRLDAAASAERLHAAEEARRESDRAAADAADRLAAVCLEVEDLCRQRDQARDALRRLTGQIGAALEAFTAPLPVDAGTGGRRPGGVVVTGNVVLAEPREPVAG